MSNKSSLSKNGFDDNNNRKDLYCFVFSSVQLWNKAASRLCDPLPRIVIKGVALVL